MELDWKKITAIVILFLGTLLSPLLLATNAMMEIYQEEIDQSPNTQFSRWLQIQISFICYKTMRPEFAVDGYARFLERYKEDSRRPAIMIEYGAALEDCARRKEATAVYEQYIEEYPEGAEKEDAQAGLRRVQYKH